MTKKYIAQSRVNHSGTNYDASAEIELDDDVATSLIKVGAIVAAPAQVAAEDTPAAPSKKK